MKPEIYQYLLIEPRARFIKNRMRAIVNLLLKDFPELKDIPKDKLVNFIHQAESFNRIFRLVLAEHPELVPEEDKEVKHILEEEKMIELGYETNYHNNVNKLKTL